MLRKSIPETLFRAILIGDTKTIRKFGKEGIEILRNIQQKKLARLIREAEKRMSEANEDICPID